MHSQMHRIYPKDCHRPSLYIFNQIFTFSCTRSPLTLGEDRAAEVRAPQFCVHWMSQSDREDKQRPDLSGNCDRIYGSVRLGGEAAELCVHLCVCASVCVCAFLFSPSIDWQPVQGVALLSLYKNCYSGFSTQ